MFNGQINLENVKLSKIKLDSIIDSNKIRFLRTLNVNFFTDGSESNIYCFSNFWPWKLTPLRLAKQACWFQKDILEIVKDELYEKHLI